MLGVPSALRPPPPPPWLSAPCLERVAFGSSSSEPAAVVWFECADGFCMWYSRCLEQPGARRSAVQIFPWCS